MIYRQPFAPIPADANKYTRGKAVLIMGSDSYTGSAVLAARASERMGAGYTEVITVPQAVDIVRASLASLVVRDRDTWDASTLKPSTSAHPCAVGIGSGFEGNQAEQAVLKEVLQTAECPVLIDGMAFDALGSADMRQILKWRKEHEYATVLTPHGGEAARLATMADIQLDETDPASSAEMLVEAYSSIVVLKGPDTYISDGVSTMPMTLGGPVLAKAGTGDVLAGMITSLLAQGVEPFEAAAFGCIMHACAGNIAARTFTEFSVTADDLVNFIPLAITEVISATDVDQPELDVDLSD